MNTKEAGTLNFFIYKEYKADDYIGACLELGIVKEGKELDQVKSDLEEAAKGYVITICENNLSDDLLNQQPPEEILQAFNKYISVLSTRKVPPENQKFQNASVLTLQVADLCQMA